MGTCVTSLLGFTPLLHSLQRRYNKILDNKGVEAVSTR